MYKFCKGFYSDVRIEDKFTTTISYMNENLRECKETIVKKAFIRVFDGKMWYYSSTSDIDNIQSELDALYEGAVVNEKIAEHPIVKLYEVNVDKCINFEKNCVRKVPLKSKQDFITTHKKMYEGAKYLRILTSLYSDRHSVYEFYSSKGASIVYDTQYCGYYFGVSLGEGEKVFNSGTRKSALSFDALSFDAAAAKAELEEFQSFLIESVESEKGSFPVILSPDVTGVFAHESFGHKSEADFMLGNENMKKEWQIGKVVGAPILSIYDSGSDLGVGYVPYDDEGTKTKMTYLIKDGVLSGRLHSASTSAAINEALTGNARAVSTNFEPIVRMTNTVVAPGKDTKEELFAKIKKGYYIKTIMHGSGMSTFTLAPNIAYEIIDGKIGRPVKIAVITGTVFETLGLIDGLSNNSVTGDSITGGCGKGEQFPLNVNHGGPFMSVSKMNIG